MTPDNQKDIWPLPKFYFLVILNGDETFFQEVSGLDTETQTIEYRHGNSKQFSTIKMPGITKTGNVILKKSIFNKDSHFFKWYSAIKMNTIKRDSVIIKLLDEKGNTTITWTLQNAWPTKLVCTDLKSGENEVSVETIEIAHEGIKIE